MGHTIIKGKGMRVNEDEEIFQFGKDWLLWSWKTTSGHWFNGKREAMQFLKQFGEIK